MNGESDSELLQLALNNRAITPQQSEIVRRELEMYPGTGAGTLLIQHRFVTDEALVKIQRQLTTGERDVSSLGNGVWVRPEDDEAKAPVDCVSLKDLPGERTLSSYLGFARGMGCSDLHLCIGVPPFVRLYGTIHYLDDDVLTPERSEELNLSMLSEQQRSELREKLQLDFALELPRVGRYRCNVYRQRQGWEGSYHIVLARVPTIDGLGLPPIVKTLTEHHHGLIIVSGPTGSGKSTTVAAMLDHINMSRADHIVTVEDPIEIVIPRRQCRITQREVGRHTHDFHSALRVTLRHDPDVISVGELRDLETTSMAIRAAETGHLVLATLHTSSAVRTVTCLMNFYPPSQRAQIRAMLSESMRGVICQQLVPRVDGFGRALAAEILVFNPAVCQIVRDEKTHQLLTAMQSHRNVGMKTMDDSLMELFTGGIISGAEAYRRAEFKELFESCKEG